MIPSNANFDTYRNATDQAPVFVLSLPALGLSYTMRKGTAGLAPTSTYMQLPGGLTQKINDLQGNATIGSLSVEIVDVGRTLLGLFGTKVWYGSAAILRAGFRGLTYPTDFIAIFTGVIESVIPNQDHTGWVFSIKDKNRVLKSQIYTIGDDGTNPISSTNPKTLDGNPLALAVSLLEDELQVAAADIDITAITALQSGRFSCARMLFSLAKAQDAMTFLEQELLRPLGLFHFVRYNGQVSIGDMLAPPTPVSIACDFTDSNTVGIPQFAQQTIYNSVAFQLDYDGSNYATTLAYADGDSITEYGLQQVLNIQSQGLRTNLQGAARAGITSRRIFQRYGGGPATLLTLTSAGLQASLVEVGDYVTVTHRLLENLDTGTLGWNQRVCQVMSVQPQWASGQLTFSLVDITKTLRAGYQYAPDSVPAWPGASAAQRQAYMFAANDSSEQSDGTSAAGVF